MGLRRGACAATGRRLAGNVAATKAGLKPGAVIALTGKAPSAPYIAARCRRVAGRTVGRALSSTGYCVTDLQYDIATGYLTLRTGATKKAATSSRCCASLRRRGLLGLKIKAKWLRRMQKGSPEERFPTPKRIEVRSYPPEERAPGGATPARGDRIFLLCNKEIWGSARLGGVRVYRTIQAFNADAPQHHVTPRTAKGDGSLSYSEVKSSLKERGRLYGWELSAFRWHAEGRRPRAGRTFLGDHGGACRIPDFAGLQGGFVWYLGGTLPASVEALNRSCR